MIERESTRVLNAAELVTLVVAELRAAVDDLQLKEKHPRLRIATVRVRLGQYDRGQEEANRITPPELEGDESEFEGRTPQLEDRYPLSICDWVVDVKLSAEVEMAQVREAGGDWRLLPVPKQPTAALLFDKLPTIAIKEVGGRGKQSMPYLPDEVSHP